MIDRLESGTAARLIDQDLSREWRVTAESNPIAGTYLYRSIRATLAPERGSRLS